MGKLPILQEKTYERPDILKILLKRVDGLKNKYRQNIALLGPQGLGKTTLIFNLLHKCIDNNLIAIYIQLKPKSLETFAKNFIGILLYQYLNTEETFIEDNIDFLIQKSKEKIPKTVKAILQINKLIKESASKDTIFSQILELPQFLYDETQKPVLLIFDEFHYFDHFELENPYLELSNKIMVQKNTMYIVVSSAMFTAANILGKKLSLLFGNFEVINMDPFDSKTAGEFIKKELGNLEINEELKDFLIYLTGGYPFYLDIITEQIKCSCLNNDTNTVTENILMESLGECLYKNHGILNQHFNNKYHALLNTNHNNPYPAILLAIAMGLKKPSQIGKMIGKKASDVNRHINKLIQLDIISKKGVFNTLNDPLLIYWLRFVFCPKQNSFNMDVISSMREFEQDIKKMFNDFLNESKKDIPLRLKELFELFENDIVELDRKRFMLTHFDEINIRKNNGICTLDARKLNKSWICGVADSFVDEMKIGNFLIDTKKKDCIKKILITFNGIDVNARLKALEAKVWIWDQGTVNDLFSLYEKPRVIK